MKTAAGAQEAREGAEQWIGGKISVFALASECRGRSDGGRVPCAQAPRKALAGASSWKGATSVGQLNFGGPLSFQTETEKLPRSGRSGSIPA